MVRTAPSAKLAVNVFDNYDSIGLSGTEHVGVGPQRYTASITEWRSETTTLALMPEESEKGTVMGSTGRNEG